MGFAAYKKKCKKSCMYNGVKKEGIYFRTNIHGNGLEEIPVKLLRKKVNPRKQIKDALVSRIKVIKKDVDDYYGFEINGNHRFLLGDFTVTHNTSMSLFIISKLRVKTLVIVHKTFLLNQWIERIKEFLPDAKIGIIQGQILDVENKGIVIGMLQSLCSKTYPENIINSFGLTVVDECHHLSSRMFSKSLLKIVTKYTLGLSATMQRNDGLSHVFKEFLGDIVYSYSRPKDDKVLIKAIEYNSNDPEFQEIKYDYRGNPQYSTMITKISSYNDRSEFIIKVLQNELNLNKNQHIIILSQNKNLLVYLFNAITHRNIGTVGYYVGGMKEAQLKETENKKIILATYAMAAEGLDIKTLSTLILASPRSDITQAVGRILRVKRDQPLVIDIIDEHSIFKNQFKKRKTFYNKNNYKIIHSNNKNYFNNIWTEESTKKKTSKINKNSCLLKI